MEQRLEDVGQIEAGLLRTKCYLSEGWSLKEGRKGHESLQQSGREDGQVWEDKGTQARGRKPASPPRRVQLHSFKNDHTPQSFICIVALQSK